MKGCKKCKKTKRSHAYRPYGNTYNVGILNFFNSELQFKGAESTIRNKLKDLLTQLNGVKFVTKLV